MYEEQFSKRLAELRTKKGVFSDGKVSVTFSFNASFFR